MKKKINPLSEGVEISWFAPLCDGDDDFFGNRNPNYKSNWKNTASIVKSADKLGYRNILCPSSYQVGQDTLSFISGMSTLTKKINFLAAIRCGELHPPMLARSIATIDHMLKGRLTLNIISSDLPGTIWSSYDRYNRSREVIQILKQAWTQDEINFKGKYYHFKLPSDPVKPFQQNGGPLLYFGGYSQDPSSELKKTFGDVEGYDDMVLQKNISVSSHCEHHMAPIIGVAHVAYLPNKRIVGLSKIARTVEIFSKRLQTQERLTMQIANTLTKGLDAFGVAVAIDSTHQCMTMRGIKKEKATTVTNYFTGKFKEDLSFQNRFLGYILDKN